MSTPDLEKTLKIASHRLGDAMTFFAAAKAVSESCRGDLNPLLSSYINKNQYWTVCYAAFQTSIFINISALVDKRSDCASFQTAANLMHEQEKQLPEALLAEINAIRELYTPFRNKVFAHTDHNWSELGDDFDNAGFTWDSIHGDLIKLDYIRQALWAIFLNMQIPSRDEALANLSFDHLRVMQIDKDVEQLFKWVTIGLSEA